MTRRPSDDVDDFPISENLAHVIPHEPQPLPPREVVDEEAEVHRLRCPLCGGRIYAWPDQGERCERCGQEPRGASR